MACPSPSRPSSTGCAASPVRRTSRPRSSPSAARCSATLPIPTISPRPRLVVAVTGDRAAGPGSPRLADRLFLGYQPAADAIEAISYNEAAGRFEFQDLVGYSKGARPEPAERRVCLACHQGGGPIFARPLWSETNANPAIADRLAPWARASTARRCARPSTGSRPSTPPPTAPPASPSPPASGPRPARMPPAAPRSSPPPSASASAPALGDRARRLRRRGPRRRLPGPPQPRPAPRRARRPATRWRPAAASIPRRRASPWSSGPPTRTASPAPPAPSPPRSPPATSPRSTASSAGRAGPTETLTLCLRHHDGRAPLGRHRGPLHLRRGRRSG